jgi:hypothetical protein
MKRTGFVCLLLASSFVAGSARAQSAAAAPPKVHKIGGVTVQGSFRTRMEAWDWFQGDTGDNSYAYSGNLLRLSFSQSLESVDWQVELAVPFLLGLPDNALASGAQGQLGLGAGYFVANDRSPNASMLFPKQAFVRFKRLGGSANHSLRLGRFEFIDGSEIVPKNGTLAALKRDRINQRLIGSFGWTHVGRSFDGFHYQWNTAKGNFTVVGAVPTRGVFQTDGWGWNKSGVGYASYTRPWGTGAHVAETRALAIYYHDWRRVLKTDNRALAARQADAGNIGIASFGGHHLSVVQTSAGAVDVMLWGVAQTGRWGALDHRGTALAAEAGIQPKVWPKLKPWVRAGFFDGSGDSDANDGTHGSFFQVLPTPRPFARFPFFNLMNNRDLNAMLVLRPHAKVTVSSEFHALRLSNRRDLWYVGGGVFQPWTFGYVGRPASGAQSLANLYDTSVDYRFNTNTTITGYVGYANGRAATSAIYPQGKDGLFGYLELVVRF